jgi:hypothetical protein
MHIYSSDKSRHRLEEALKTGRCNISQGSTTTVSLGRFKVEADAPAEAYFKMLISPEIKLRSF